MRQSARVIEGAGGFPERASGRAGADCGVVQGGNGSDATSMQVLSERYVNLKRMDWPRLNVTNILELFREYPNQSENPG